MKGREVRGEDIPRELVEPLDVDFWASEAALAAAGDPYADDPTWRRYKAILARTRARETFEADVLRRRLTFEQRQVFYAAEDGTRR